MLRLITFVVKIVHEVVVRVTRLVVLPQLFDSNTLEVPVGNWYNSSGSCKFSYKQELDTRSRLIWTKEREKRLKSERARNTHACRTKQGMTCSYNN